MKYSSIREEKVEDATLRMLDQSKIGLIAALTSIYRRSMFRQAIYLGLQAFALELSRKLLIDTDFARRIKKSASFKALDAAQRSKEEANALEFCLNLAGISSELSLQKIQEGKYFRPIQNFLDAQDINKTRKSVHDPIAEAAVIAAAVAGAKLTLPAVDTLPSASDSDEDRTVLDNPGLFKLALELLRFVRTKLAAELKMAVSSVSGEKPDIFYFGPTQALLQEIDRYIERPRGLFDRITEVKQGLPTEI